MGQMLTRPLEKWMKNYKPKTCKKSSFLNGGVENGAMLTTYSDILQNAPFLSQIFIIFFASGGKGELTP